MLSEILALVFLLDLMAGIFNLFHGRRRIFRTGPEYHFIVHEEIHQTDDAQCNQITPYNVPLRKPLKQQQHRHFQEKGRGIGKIVGDELLEETLVGKSSIAVTENDS